MKTPLPVLELEINQKTVAELLPGDPMVDSKAAYRLLQLVRKITVFNDNTYALVEISLKRQYWAYRTGVSPENQNNQDIEHVSLLEALVFFQELGLEAEKITLAANSAWSCIVQRRLLDEKATNVILKLAQREEEGDEFAGAVLALLREYMDLA